jgi:heme/copper-type cytochrome/quinol oxidase subunit 2
MKENDTIAVVVIVILLVLGITLFVIFRYRTMVGNVINHMKSERSSVVTEPL